jgi:alanine dehydrogenase
MKLIDREAVRARLDPDALLTAVEKALVDVSAGRASVPPRIASFTPDGLMGAMVAYVPSLNVLAAKLVSVFNQHEPSHQAVIVAFDPKTGTPIAAMDGTEITAQRTAAVSALATKLLAREDAKTLAIIGTGVQARSHAFHVRRVRKFSEVLVAGRDRAKAERLAAEVGGRAVSLDEASQADVICVTTHSPTALLEDARPGAHINSVGLNPKGSELGKALLDKSTLFVESRASALAPFPIGAFELQGRTAVELGEIIHDGAGVGDGSNSPFPHSGERGSGGMGVGSAAGAGIRFTAVTRRIQEHLKRKYGLLVSDRTAELVWMGLGAHRGSEAATMDAQGEDADGATRVVAVSSHELPIGRASGDEITLYKSVGIAAEDAAAASLVLR